MPRTSGTFVFSTALPTTIVTFEPGSTCVLDWGVVEMTLPTWFGSFVGWSVQTAVRSPPLSTWALASSQVRPTTSGTVAFSSALATSRVTVEPFSSSLPGSGFWLRIVPSSWEDSVCLVSTSKPLSSSCFFASSMFLSMTFGTATLGAPVETTRLTVDSLSTSVPCLGSWAQMLPLGWSSHSCCLNVSTRSMLSACCWASALLRPMKAGTGTLSLPGPPSPLKAYLPIRMAPTRTRTPASTRKIVEVFFLRGCWRRRSGRSS